MQGIVYHFVNSRKLPLIFGTDILAESKQKRKKIIFLEQIVRSCWSFFEQVSAVKGLQAMEGQSGQFSQKRSSPIIVEGQTLRGKIRKPSHFSRPGAMKHMPVDLK